MNQNEKLFGLMAEFEKVEGIMEAARHVHEKGYVRVDAYTPFPVDGLAEAMGVKRTSVPTIVLIGGLIGGCGGFFMLWYANVISYPWIIAGRPHNSWPAWIPITFELTILIAGLASFFGMLWLNGLPRPHHPVFNAPSFHLASRDRFFLCIQADDEVFDRERTWDVLESLHPVRVMEVPL